VLVLGSHDLDAATLDAGTTGAPSAVFRALQDAWTAGDQARYLALWRFADADAEAAEREFIAGRFATQTRLEVYVPDPSSAPLGTRIIGAHAQLVTLDEPWGRVEQMIFRVERANDGWRLISRDIVGEIAGLAHLALDPNGFKVAGHVLRLPDFEMEMRSGTLFTSPDTLGRTVLVFVGDGRVRFHPHRVYERAQLAKFMKRPELDRELKLAFVRIAPGDFDSIVTGPPLAPDPASPLRWRAAQRFYTAHAESAFTLDAPIPGSPWWIVPPSGDALVVFDYRDGPLTLSVSAGRPEGISLFDRDKRRQICLYPEEGRSRDFDEDEDRTVDLQHQDLRLKIDPYTDRLEGEARLRLSLLAPTASLRLRLNEALRIDSITSDDGRRLLFFRVRHQGTIMVALPPTQRVANEITLNIRYRGTLRPAPFERENTRPMDPAPAPHDERFVRDMEGISVSDTAIVYSQPSYWYPQAETDDYATASVEVELPAGFAVVAPGRRLVTPLEGDGTRTRYDVDRPVKHLVMAVGRLIEAGRREEGGVTLTAFSTARLRSDAQRMLDMAAQILRLFVEEFGPCPYPYLQLVFMEAPNPGGHSPPGLSIVVRRPLSLRAILDDPANFVDVPGFFLAHELSHQWWGDGVTGRSYHDRWISEAMSQYAAARWVRHSQGAGEFRQVMSDMARWALRENDAGPIFLGHRIGHIESDSKLFRAVVYDKGAWVLHMLRGIIGDDAFRRGIRSYQESYRFQKAGTPQLRDMLSEAGGVDLGPYFESWVYGTELPTLSLAHHTAASAGHYRTTVTVRAAHLPGPVPLGVTLRFDGAPNDEKVERLAPEGGQWTYVTAKPPRKVQINDDPRILARRDD
jgi:hypothetical protein